MKCEIEDVSSADDFLIPAKTQVIAQITSESLYHTKKGGQMLIMNFQVLDGEYRDWTFSTNFQVQNENKDVQRRAMAKIREIARAVGFQKLAATEQLHHKPMLCTVGVTTNQFQEEQNYLSYCKPISPEQMGMVAKAANEKAEKSDSKDDDFPF